MSSIATALSHARENHLPVEVLVEGHWLTGQVAIVDGFGILLERESSGQSVIRIESIAAVTVEPDADASPNIIQQRMAVVR